MYIHEAIAARTRKEPFIARKKWKDLFSISTGAKIFPTDSPDCCVMESSVTSSRGWQPTKEDLIADDWETVGYRR